MHPIAALNNLTKTTLRNVTGELELDQTLTSRDTINAKLQAILDEATDPWGICVGRVEIQDIRPSDSVVESMEKQMKAERERRETLLEAEGHKQASITKAEGDRQALVIKADKVLALKRIDAFKDACDGRATKIIIPTELASEAANLQFKAEMLGLEDIGKKDTKKK